MVLLALTTVSDLDLKSSHTGVTRFSPDNFFSICPSWWSKGFHLCWSKTFFCVVYFYYFSSFCPWTLVAFSFVQTFLLKYVTAAVETMPAIVKHQICRRHVNAFPKAPPFMSTHTSTCWHSPLIILGSSLVLPWKEKRRSACPRQHDQLSPKRSGIWSRNKRPESKSEVGCSSPPVWKAERQGNPCEQVMPSSIYKHWKQKKYKWFIWFRPTCQAGESCPKSASFPILSLKLV